jgi:neprilysin
VSVVNNVCLTEECLNTASKMLDSLDLSVEPCDDFYNFACGKFVEETNIPDDKVVVNTFSIIGDEMQEQMLTLVGDLDPEFELESLQLAKELFAACMNKKMIDERDAKPMFKMHKLLGGWPVLKGDDWDDESWTWEQSVRDFRKYGFSTNYILAFTTPIDLKNTTQRMVDVSVTHHKK